MYKPLLALSLFLAASVAVVAFVLILFRRDTMTEARLQTDHALPVEMSASAFAFLGSSAVWLCFVFFFLVTMAFGALQNYAPSLFEPSGISFQCEQEDRLHRLSESRDKP